MIKGKKRRRSYPENIDLERAIKGRKETIYIMLWTSGELLGTCVIWCKGFTLWHLVNDVSGVRV